MTTSGQALQDLLSADPSASQMLDEFHRLFNFERTTDPSLRRTLHDEEFDELVEALDDGDRLAVARELADVVYVSYGSAWSLGIDLDSIISREELGGDDDLAVAHARLLRAIDAGEVDDVGRALAAVVRTTCYLFDAWGIDICRALAEVHRANLSKLDDDMRPIYREDGKVMKGPNFRKPDMTVAV